MVEALFGLVPETTPGTFGATGLPGITMGSRPLRGLCQIAGWDGFEQAAQPALEAADLSGLGDYHCAQVKGQATAWRIAPDKVLIEGAQDLTTYDSPDLAVLDLSHSRIVITLDGESARDLLSALIALDMREAALPPTNYVQTVIHGIGVLVHCTARNSFEILVPLTWSRSLWDFVFETALSFGVTVKDC